MRSALLVFVCVCGACAGTARDTPEPVRPAPKTVAPGAPALVPVPVVSAEPSAVAVLASAAPAASSAAAPAEDPAPIDPGERMTIAPLYRPLFEEGRRFVYRSKDDVDPHAPDGGRVASEALLDCAIEGVTWRARAVTSTLACRVRGEETSEGVLPTGTWGFLATPEGLSMSNGPNASDPPTAPERVLLPATPVAARSTYDIPAMTPPAVDKCTALVEIYPLTTCSDVRCEISAGYGNTHDRECFSPDRGMESLLQENLHGPRVTSWKLIAVHPAKPAAAPAATSPL